LFIEFIFFLIIRCDSNKYSIDFILSLNKLKSKRKTYLEKVSDLDSMDEIEDSSDENELMDQNV
jgi:hypothetical protein